MSINKVLLTGFLTRDAETKRTSTGAVLLCFSIAVNDRIKDSATGEWKDKPNFIDCSLFGARAESLGRFLVKGAKVAVEGKLDYQRWEKDGATRSRIQVKVTEIELMSRTESAEREQRGEYVKARPIEAQASAYDSDDVPF